MPVDNMAGKTQRAENTCNLPWPGRTRRENGARAHRLLQWCAIGLILCLCAIPTALAQKAFQRQTELNTNAETDAGDDFSPKLATDFLGTWVAVWNSDDPLDGTLSSDTNVLFARSIDNGETWSEPAALSDNTAINHDQVSFPHIATDGRGAWVVVWSASGRFGTDSDILAVHSTNNGETWTLPVPVNSNAKVDSEFDDAPRIATDRLGRWMTVWTGENDANDEVTYYARSKDNGAHWNRRRSPGSNGGDELGLFPDVVVDERKNWVVVWSREFANESQFGGDFEIVVARTSNFGTTWSGPLVLNADAQADSSNDDDFLVRIASAGKNRFVAVWGRRFSGGIGAFTSAQILSSRSTDGGLSWTDPVKLDVADTDAQDAVGFPEVASDGSKTFSAVWQHLRRFPNPTPDRVDILIAVSTDIGATWTDPSLVSANIIRESAENGLPDIATDRSNRSIVVWTSNIVLRSRILVGDYDIHYAPDF